MKCPYCADSSEDYLSEESLGYHILREHPEKTMSADAYGKAISGVIEGHQAAQVASYLAYAAAISNKSPKEIVEMYKEILRLLYGSPM